MCIWCSLVSRSSDLGFGLVVHEVRVYDILEGFRHILKLLRLPHYIFIMSFCNSGIMCGLCFRLSYIVCWIWLEGNRLSRLEARPANPS